MVEYDYKNKEINMKQQLTTLLSKEMDRKDFLKYMAAAGVMAMGGGVILQSLGGLDKLGLGAGQQARQEASQSYGYGASVYGGNRG